MIGPRLKRAVLKALDEYSELLEAGIECHTVPGTLKAIPAEQEILDDLRRRWQRTEKLKIALEAMKVAR